MAFTHLNEWLKQEKEKWEKAPREGFFVVIPYYVIEDPKLPDKSKVLYGLISALANKEGYCYATNSYLADKLGCKERIVRYHLSILKRKKLIKVEVEKNSTGTWRKIWIAKKPIL